MDHFRNEENLYSMRLFEKQTLFLLKLHVCDFDPLKAECVVGTDFTGIQEVFY